MPNLTLTTGATSLGQISSAHLGGNYQSAFTDLGPNNQDFHNLGMSVLRYPGGTYTEYYFDINNPNYLSASYQNQDIDITNTLVPQTSTTDEDGTFHRGFLNFCAENYGGEIDAIMVIPMRQGLDGPGWNEVDGTTGRALTDGWHASVYAYVLATLQQAHDLDVTLRAFELGNEYETFMTSGEYALVASTSAAATRAAIDDFTASHSGYDEPLIAVQVAAEDANYSRNNAVLAQFTNAGLAAIDAVIGHYYQGTNLLIEIVEDTANTYPVLWEAMALWDDKTGRPLERLITEWNVAHTGPNSLGLRQIDPLLAMFTNFLMNGVDMANIWALQYNANAMFDVSGWQNGLTIAGNFVSVMLDTLPGKHAVEIDEILENFNAYAFANDDEATVFITSVWGGTGSVTLSFGGMNTSILDSATLGVGPNNSTNDPNAAWSSTAGTYTFGQNFNLAPFEVMMITFDLNIEGTSIADTLLGTIFDDQLFGMDGNDTLNGGQGADILHGGGGIDVARYSGALQGVSADLQNAASNTFEAAGDTYHNIENLSGSGFHDILRGDSGQNSIWGLAGDDRISGRGGKDQLFGDGGNDRLWGGDGNDVLDGGDGNDKLYGEKGSDALSGGGGQDWVYGGFGDDTIHGHAGNDRLYGEAGDDTIFGGDGRDSIKGHAGDDVLHGGAGNDTLRGNAGSDILRGNTGDDRLIGHGGNDRLVGGSGNDEIKGGSGADVLLGGDGDDRLIGMKHADQITGGTGADTFVFIDAAGLDVVTDYQVGVDALEFGASYWQGVASAADLVATYAVITAAGVVFDFGGGNILTLEGLVTTGGLAGDVVGLM